MREFRRNSSNNKSTVVFPSSLITYLSVSVVKIRSEHNKLQTRRVLSVRRSDRCSLSPVCNITTDAPKVHKDLIIIKHETTEQPPLGFCVKWWNQSYVCDAASWSLEAQECRRKRATRGRWSDEWCWLGSPFTSFSSASLTRASLDNSCRPRCGAALHSGNKDIALWFNWSPENQSIWSLFT